jgi:hypothetical protein
LKRDVHCPFINENNEINCRIGKEGVMDPPESVGKDDFLDCMIGRPQENQMDTR